MTPQRSSALVLTLAFSFIGSAAAAGLKIELPAESTAMKSGPGSDLVRDQCLTCHSFDYIATQPSGKPRPFWKAEVEKMKKVYGAPIPDDQIDPIADYLTRNYGDQQSK